MMKTQREKECVHRDRAGDPIKKTQSFGLLISDSYPTPMVQLSITLTSFCLMFPWPESEPPGLERLPPEFVC